MNSAMLTKLKPGNYFGTLKIQRKLPGFNISETAYKPNDDLPKHYHENPYFCFVLKGSFDEHSGIKEKAHCTNSIIYHPSGEVHSDRFLNTCASCLNIEIENSLRNRLNNHMKLLDDPFSRNDLKLAEVLQKIYYEYRNFDDVSSLALEGMVLEFFSMLFRNSMKSESRCPAWLKEAKEIIEARFLENITVQELAVFLKIHPVHLVRRFHDHFGVTIGNYQRKLRIGYALRQLSDKGLSLAEIALSSGFSDQSHFTRVFKQFTNLTPSQYRRSVIS